MPLRIYTPHATTFAEAGLPPREAVRPLEFRHEGFDDAYDSTTLYYDAVRVGGRAVLLSPPFNNASAAVRDAVFRYPSDPARTVRFRLRTGMDRHAQTWLRVPAGTDALQFTAPGTGVTVRRPLQATLADDFDGRRVLLTMSKDNPIRWVEDWVRFHRDVHGADAVLLYDNGSTDYSVQELGDALVALAGIRTVVVVSWHFRYGPQGLDASRFWDSDYAQLAALEHARWLFLGRASGVLNADIDELVLSSSGHRLFDLLTRSPAGAFRLSGLWVPGVTTEPSGADVRHRDFETVQTTDPCRPKYALVPRRCPRRAQWRVHRVAGWPTSLHRSRDLSFRHFRQISNGWKYGRSDRQEFDGSRHMVDERLKGAFARVDWST